MFTIEMLPAGPGDALVVEYGTRTKHRLLIDAGPVSSWPDVRARLLARRDNRYDLFVITHVDEDHVGGALSLLDDPDLRHKVPEVWFNGYVHCAEGGNILGPVHGEQLTERIAEGGLGWNTGIPRSPALGTGGPIVVPTRADLPVIDLPDGARLVLIGPSGPKLKAMAKEWSKKVIEAGLVPGEGAEGHLGGMAPRVKEVEPLPPVLDTGWLTTTAATKQRDSSKANAASISFVLEYDGKRLLLNGDATADVLTANIARYGRFVGEERPRIDLFKLPHHGSGANLTTALVEAMAATRYLVSSDGAIHGHPDDSALARLILASPAAPTLYCNYASTRTIPWSERAEEVGATFVLPKPGKKGLKVAV